MNTRSLIKKYLTEIQYNYHYGNDVDTKTPKPHQSDSIFLMDGRGTGHFGSGMYFSTYKCYNSDIDKKYGKDSDFEFRKGRNHPELIQVEKGVYRVDMDLYKNLYRVTNNNHGDILFKTLKHSNELFYWAYKEILEGNIPKEFSDEYIKLEHNFKSLELKIPTYREFINMIKKAGNDLKNHEEASSNASFSTRLMEYNGFNGVNVSNISNYDNTTHGSVIYDIKKINSNIKKVKNPGAFCEIKYGVAGDSMDIKTKILRGEEIFNWTAFNKLPYNEKLKLMKRYNHLSPTDTMDNETKELFYKTLKPKLRKNIINPKMDHFILADLIDNGYMDIIYDENIRVGENTLLYYALDKMWKLPSEYGEKLVNNINRNLTDEEKQALEEM